MSGVLEADPLGGLRELADAVIHPHGPRGLRRGVPLAADVVANVQDLVLGAGDLTREHAGRIGAGVPLAVRRRALVAAPGAAGIARSDDRKAVGASLRLSLGQFLLRLFRACLLSPAHGSTSPLAEGSLQPLLTSKPVRLESEIAAHQPLHSEPVAIQSLARTRYVHGRW